MAPSLKTWAVMVVFVAIFLPQIYARNIPCPQASTLECLKFKGIMAFGDSLTDDGNFHLLYGNSSKYRSHTSHPYHNPRGYRAGNGLTILDFISKAFGFPFIKPSFNRTQENKGDYAHGANFAVAGATARDTPIFVPNYLSTQVHSFVSWKTKGHLSQDLIANSLYYINIGVNDVWQPVDFLKATVKELQSTIVEEATDSVVKAIKRLYEEGGRTFVVFGLPAMGCDQMLEGVSGTKLSSDYDHNHCFKPYNNISRLHNELLKQKIAKAKEELTGASVLYVDMYELHEMIIEKPKSFGFTKEGVESICCGGKGYYHHPVETCSNLNVCSHPNFHISFDGLHFTEAFNRQAAKYVLQTPIPKRKLHS